MRAPTISTHHRWRIFKRGKAICRSCAMVLIASTAAQAAPEGGVVKAGQGAISRDGANTQVDQTSQRLDIDWRSFSTEAHEAVRFAQPDANAVAINRVVGGVPSHLKGALEANGKVFLLNTAGVTFHKGATVNVGALLATTAELDGESADQLHFVDASGNAVVNAGDITIGKGGFAILAAPRVENHGTVTAEQGTIALASSKNYTLDLRGDKLITYTVQDETAEQLGVTNTGTLKAVGGEIALSADIASELAQQSMNLDGIVDVSGFGEGKITITSRGDVALNKVTVDAGKGGNIYTWADGTNHLGKDATLQADGGTVELSGNHIALEGTLDAGKGGNVILDPQYLRLRSGNGPALTDVVYEETVEALSQGGTNVTLRAEREITVEDLADDLLSGGSGSITLRNANDSDVRTTNGGIRFLDWDDTIRTTSGDIRMQAGSAGIIAGNLQAETGRIVLDTINKGNIQTGSLTIENTEHSASVPAQVNLDINADGSLDINGDISLKQQASNAGETTRAVMQAKLQAKKRILVKGDVTVLASAFNSGESAANTDSVAKLEATSSEDTVQLQKTLKVEAGSGLGDGVAGGAVTAKADALFTAANRVQLDGVTDVTASSSQKGDAAPASVQADATLDIVANDVLLRQDVDVAAYANSGNAAAAASKAKLVVEATDNRVLTEGAVRSRAESGLGGEGAISADALTQVIAAGDAVLQGAVESNANTRGGSAAIPLDDRAQGEDGPLELYAACDECWGGTPPARARTIIDTELGETLNPEVLPLAMANSSFAQNDETTEDLTDDGYSLVLFDTLPTGGHVATGSGNDTMTGGGDDSTTGGGNDTTTGGGDDTNTGGGDDTTTGGGDDTTTGGGDDTTQGGGDDTTTGGGDDTTTGGGNDGGSGDTVSGGNDTGSGGGGSTGGSGPSGGNDVVDSGSGGNASGGGSGGDAGSGNTGGSTGGAADNDGDIASSGPGFGSDADVPLLSSQEGSEDGDFTDEMPIELAGLTAEELAGLNPAAEGRDFCRDVNGKPYTGLSEELEPCPHKERQEDVE